ncbi:uncharacterized protein LOC132307809 [Cornus florida]|uniref:uncharacterized protein LOC132307809 n=1 Tax=Cornus florida TaxID=4283 RepID=UPI002898DDAD|nr:uncharacterized protein LOC132307809 [Cornus florida]
MGFIIGTRRRNTFSLHKILLLFSATLLTGFSTLLLNHLSSVDPPTQILLPLKSRSDPVQVHPIPHDHLLPSSSSSSSEIRSSPSCATVEQMGEEATPVATENLRIRRLIRDHFSLHGASRVRRLPPEKFCRQGFVMGKASQAGFGNEMYRILTAAGLSVMLNRSLIIGQTRGKFPFEDYVSYSNLSFTLKEVKHLWRKNDCLGKYRKCLVMRIDDFNKPEETNVLCRNWRKWKQPIIWFQGTTDAVAAQFFLKNIHPQMRSAASSLFGNTELLQSRPNVFGELMRVIISPSRSIEEALSWALDGGPDPHLALHMRMLMNRPVRAVTAAMNCIKKAILTTCPNVLRPRVVVISDTPSFVKDILPKLQEFAEVLHFDYKLYKGNISGERAVAVQQLGFRVKDWGPSPRWVAFVDFFLASRAKHAVISGAHRRIGTTYAQLIAALAAAHQLGENNTVASNFSFFSSFQSNLLSQGLRHQVGWGHAWNRFAGPLSCHNQPNQCALTPLLPPGWWDGTLQSPIARDIRRLDAYGVKLNGFGTVDETHLHSSCKSRKHVVKTIPIIYK